jgi:hypothetical protein
MSSEDQKPPARLTLDVGGTERTVFMSFGLLNEIAALVQSPENVPELSFNSTVSTAALHLMLAPRDKRGNILPEKDDEPAVPLDLDPEVAEQLLDWAGAHVLDFFVRRLAKSAALFATRADQLAAAGSSLTSSANLAGKTA